MQGHQRLCKLVKLYKSNKLSIVSVLHTNTPVLTIPKTSASLVNKVAKEPKDTPRIADKITPVNNPIWKKHAHQSQTESTKLQVCIRHIEYNGEGYK